MRGQRDTAAVAAVDVGTSKVLAAVAVPEPDGLRVLGVGRASAAGGVRRGAVVDLGAVTAAITAAAERARRVSGRQLPPVTLGSAGGEIVACNRGAEIRVDPPGELEPSHVGELLEEVRGAADLPAGYQVVHAIPREYIVDGYEGCSQPVGMAAARLGVAAHLVACQSTLLRNLWKAAADGGLEVEDFAVAGLASAEAVLTDEERRLGAVLLDMGAGSTQVTVVMGGETAGSAVVPVGGAHVTADIAAGLGIGFEAAEDVKHRHGSVDAAAAAADRPPEWLAPLRPGGAAGEQVTERHFREIVVARVEEIVERAAEAIAASGLQGATAAGAVLTGGGSRLRGLAAVAMRGLGLRVRCGGALGAAGALAAPECAAIVGLLQFAARRHTGGRRLPPVPAAAGSALVRWLLERRRA